MTEFLQNHHQILLGLELLYLIAVGLLAGKIIIDTKTTSKTLAYLLLIIFLPVVGIIIYFLFGVNYRKNQFYQFKIVHNDKLYQEVQKWISEAHQKVNGKHSVALDKYQSTIAFLFRASQSPLSENNRVEVLINGEKKFPRLFQVLQEAKHHIHLEYYIFEDDWLGQKVAEILIQKAQEGLAVRLLYDDLGSGKLTKKLKEKLRAAGVQVAPVNKISFRLLANRVNYRDHRKIIIVDGLHVFTGGINVSQKYVNIANTQRFWRDTHLYISGPASFYFQYLFFSNWIVSTKELPEIDQHYFNTQDSPGSEIVQVAASGPDTKPAIMMSTVSAIYTATQRIYITTPYFIPVESVLQALRQMALAGLDVRLLVPEEGDSKLVNAAAFSYYEELLESGVKIYFYQKGFIHAKTMLIDEDLAIVGTANMDVRSQELNFEVNTMLYSKKVAQELADQFIMDLRESREIHHLEWVKRPRLKRFFEHLARLFSPLL